jgi:hypothetical protein
MNKGLRILIATLLLVSILLLARDHIAWAGNLDSQSTGILQSQNQSAFQGDDRDREPGSVKPPPVVVPPITKPGTYSVGGVCVLVVERLAANVSVQASLQSFKVLEKHPKEIGRYLSGVCSVAYVKDGKGIPRLAPADGSVKICFARVPKKHSKIYVYDGKHWIGLDTKVEGGLVCADASRSGKYVLVSDD